MRRLSRLLLTAVLLPVVSALYAQNIYLVAVGVSDYPGEVNDLALPANDARSVCRLYKTNSRVDAMLLTDRRATHSEILTKSRNLLSKAKPEDIVVFFFSGHGMPGGFCAYDETLSYQEIRRLFSACKAKNKMIFADACFAGDMRENKPGSGPDPGSNVMLFLSSRENETSIESPSMKNGFFTAALIGGLKGGADTNRDRTITARELFVAVSGKVKDLSHDRQHPVMWGNFDDNMPVIVW